MNRGLVAIALATVAACGGSGGSDDSAGTPGGDGADGGAGSTVLGGDASAAQDAASSRGDASTPVEDGGAAMNDGACGATASPPSAATGCGATSLYAVPDDPGARGPWPVGVKTVTVQGLVTEVWYPAVFGSDACAQKVNYDLRQQLPTSEQSKIPDADNPLQPCDCYRDLPIDAAHGPYPVISFIHGTAAFRTQSLTFMTHWASRGFVVVASDHPHIQLKDFLAGDFIGSDQTGDALKVLAALDAPSGDLAFLTGHLDMARVAASGHSAGGGAVSAIAGKRAGVQVVIPMAAQGVTKGGDLKSSLVMSAANDGIAMPSGQVSGYQSSTSPPKRFVQIDRAGHLVFSDLCSIGASEGGLLAIAQKYNVNGASLLASLANDGCPWMKSASYTPIAPADGWAIVNYATSAVLEETLFCRPAMAAKIAAMKTAFPLVKDYEEQLQ